MKIIDKWTFKQKIKLIAFTILLYIGVLALTIVVMKVTNPDLKWSYFWPPNHDKFDQYYHCYMITGKKEWNDKFDSIKNIMYYPSFGKKDSTKEKEECDCK